MTATALVFEKGRAQERPLPEARAAIGKARLVWIDTDERTPEIDGLLAALAVHPLTVEDIFETRTVPKVEDYGSYIFVLAHAVHLPASGPTELREAELDIVVGPGWVFTHHDAPLTAPARVREEVARAEHPIDASGVLHLLLDRLVDDALPAMDAFDDAVERLEQASLRRIPRRDTVARGMALRGALHRFRRTAVHQREGLLRLGRGEFERIPREQLPFFRDVHDHAVRIADLIEDARDLLSGVLEAHLSMVSNRLNEIMKVLTMFATVFLPVSFIASVYGMNFEGMPELHWRYGYPAALLAMAVTAGGLLWWFRRRGWFE